MSTSDHSPKEEQTLNSLLDQNATAGTDGGLKPTPVQVFKRSLETHLAAEGIRLPIKSKQAFKLEVFYCKGYLDAMQDGPEKYFLAEFLLLLYISGRSVTSLGC